MFAYKVMVQFFWQLPTAMQTSQQDTAKRMC